METWTGLSTGYGRKNQMVDHNGVIVTASMHTMIQVKKKKVGFNPAIVATS